MALDGIAELNKALKFAIESENAEVVGKVNDCVNRHNRVLTQTENLPTSAGVRWVIQGGRIVLDVSGAKYLSAEEIIKLYYLIKASEIHEAN
jgi:hypothetical protein